jgi:hypothetical protein
VSGVAQARRVGGAGVVVRGFPAGFAARFAAGFPAGFDGGFDGGFGEGLAAGAVAGPAAMVATGAGAGVPGTSGVYADLRSCCARRAREDVGCACADLGFDGSLIVGRGMVGDIRAAVRARVRHCRCFCVRPKSNRVDGTIPACVL